MRVLKNEKGSALIIALLFILFFFVVINGLITNGVSLKQSALTEEESIKLKYVVESVSVIVKNQLINNSAWEGPLSGDLDGYRYMVTKKTNTLSTITFQLEAKRMFNGTEYVKRADVTYERASAQIVDWK